MTKGLVLLTAAVALCVFASGCSTFKQWTGQQEVQKPKEEGPNQVFYGFPDIPAPKEMTLARDKTFIYEAPNIKAGVLVLTGNVEMPSLENYFRIFMPKNGWRFVNSYKYGDTIMNFTKEDRSAIVRIFSTPLFSTQAEIWVGPLNRQYDRYDKGMENFPAKGNEMGGSRP